MEEISEGDLLLHEVDQSFCELLIVRQAQLVGAIFRAGLLVDCLVSIHVRSIITAGLDVHPDSASFVVVHHGFLACLFLEEPFEPETPTQNFEGVIRLQSAQNEDHVVPIVDPDYV